MVERFPARKSRPFGRSHPCDPAALLIDQDRDFVMPLEISQRIRQGAQLLPSLNISAEQDIARGRGIAEEVALVGTEFGPFQPVDDSFHQFTTRQLSPAAFSAVQAERTCSADPEARRR
jgi:hypothetical protein